MTVTLETARRRRRFVTFWHGDRRLCRCKISDAMLNDVLEAQGHVAQTHGLTVEQVEISYRERED